MTTPAPGHAGKQTVRPPVGSTDNTPSGMRADIPALARRYQALLRRRMPWDTAWQSLADHFLPTRCRLRPQGGGSHD